jgi:hypothetical protein
VLSLKVAGIAVLKVEDILDVVLLVEANLDQVVANKPLFFFQVLIVLLDLLQLKHLLHLILFPTLEAVLEVLQLGIGLQIRLDHSLDVHAHGLAIVVLVELVILLLVLYVVLQLSNDWELVLVMHLSGSIVAAASA